MAAPSTAPRRAPSVRRAKGAAELIGAAAVAVLVLYPFAAYWSFRSLHTVWLAAFLIVASLARIVAARARGTPLTPALWLVPAAGVALALFSVLRAAPDAMLFYPTLVNAALLGLFAHSVLFPPTVVERIARLTDGPLSPAAIRYTRRVTIAWIAFFVLNGGLSLYTALAASLDVWALYNGFIAYFMIGAMFAGEWLVRRRVLANARGRAPEDR